MPRTAETRGLDEYADAVRARWVLVVAVALLGGLVALGASAVTAPRYRATASLVFTIPVGTSPGDLSRGPAYQQRQMRAFSELARQPLVLDAVGRDLGRTVSTQDVTALVPLGTTDLDVVADADRPAAAADLANAVARQVATTVAGLDSSPARGTLVGTAAAPRAAVSPRTRLGVAVGTVLGAVAGLVLALALDDRARRRAL